MTSQAQAIQVEAKKSEQPSKIHIIWKRFPNDPSAYYGQALKKPIANAIYGTKGAGKSSLAENIANRYKVVIDLFGSRDNEGLGWCRSERDKILFLKGPATDITCSWPTKNTTDLKLSDIEQYDAIISCSAFYPNIRQEWHSLQKLMDKLWNRMSWETPWALLIREAANLLYSRMAIGDSQQQAKNYIIYVLREMRHCGLALALDAIRWFSIDIDARTIADYTFLKAQGIEGIPDSLKFLYAWFDAFGVMRMGVEKFIIVSRAGPIGYGDSGCPNWHKKENENLIRLFDLRIEHGDEPNLGEKGAQVGDYEHVRIVQTRYETHEGMEKLAAKLGRSSKTIHTHITYHNSAIQGQGECDKCTRVKSLLSKQPLG